MAAHLYHLHTGKHVGDFTNSKTGVVDKNHVFSPGETVYNDKVDLAASFPEKFTYLGQRPGAGNMPTTPESLDAQIKALQDQKAAMEKEHDVTGLLKDLNLLETQLPLDAAKVNDAAQAVGLQTDALQELEYAAGLSGVKAEEDPYAGVGRNAPCPCGSGRKYKVCHGRGAVAAN